MTCATCRKPIAHDAVVCRGAGHAHHARCAERVGMCEVAGCRAIGFRAVDAPAPPVGAAVAGVAPGEPVWIPAPWDGLCVYCPACHGVSPWPAKACCFCDRVLAGVRPAPPFPPPAVRAVAAGVRYLAFLHLLVACLMGTAAMAIEASTLPAHGDIGDPVAVAVWPWVARRLAYCVAMALALRWVGNGIERGDAVARGLLWTGCVAMTLTLFGLPIALLVGAPLLTAASRRYFRQIASTLAT